MSARPTAPWLALDAVALALILPGGRELLAPAGRLLLTALVVVIAAVGWTVALLPLVLVGAVLRRLGTAKAT